MQDRVGAKHDGQEKRWKEHTTNEGFLHKASAVLERANQDEQINLNRCMFEEEHSEALLTRHDDRDMVYFSDHHRKALWVENFKNLGSDGRLLPDFYAHTMGGNCGGLRSSNAKLRESMQQWAVRNKRLRPATVTPVVDSAPFLTAEVTMVDTSSPILEAATRLCSSLREHGATAMIAGGAVRDLLLGRPINTVDISVSLSKRDILALFPGGERVRGVPRALAVDFEGFRFEISPFWNCSKQGGTLNTWPENVTRDTMARDFSINSLLYDPLNGRLYDLVDGCSDLKGKVLRTSYDALAAMQSDPSRVARMHRFAAAYGLEIDRSTALAAKTLVRGSLLMPPACSNLLVWRTHHSDPPVNAREWDWPRIGFEVSKVVSQDARAPGALADALQAGISCGTIARSLRVDIFCRDRASRAPDRVRKLQNFSIPLGWEHSIATAQRLRPSLSNDLKLMTTFLSRTPSGTEHIFPTAWIVFTPRKQSRRAKMFLLASLWHHVRNSPEFQEAHPIARLTEEELAQLEQDFGSKRDLAVLQRLVASHEDMRALQTFNKLHPDHRLQLVRAEPTSHMPPPRSLQAPAAMQRATPPPPRSRQLLEWMAEHRVKTPIPRTLLDGPEADSDFNAPLAAPLIDTSSDSMRKWLKSVEAEGADSMRRRDTVWTHATRRLDTQEPLEDSGFVAVLESCLFRPLVWDGTSTGPVVPTQSHEGGSGRTERRVWGIPESKLCSMFFKSQADLLEAVSILIPGFQGRQAFRTEVQRVLKENAEELAARHMVSSFVRDFGGAVFLETFGPIQDVPRLFPPSLVDLTLSLLAARIWDDPHLMQEPVKLPPLLHEAAEIADAMIFQSPRLAPANKHAAVVEIAWRKATPWLLETYEPGEVYAAEAFNNLLHAEAGLSEPLLAAHQHGHQRRRKRNAGGVEAASTGLPDTGNPGA